MQNMVSKLLLIVVLLVLCVWAIVPPKDKIRLGKDLQGGVSLIYHVNIDPEEKNKQDILNQTITVLKDRVNPTGVLDISMQPLGVDRIEVAMPLAGEEVQQLRLAYDNALEGLLDKAEIPTSDLDSAVRLGNSVQQFGGSEGTRRFELINQLQDAFNAWQEADAAYKEAKEAGQEMLGALAQAVADTKIEYEDTRAEVLHLSLDRASVIRTLQLPTEDRQQKDDDNNVIRDPDTNEPILLPSQRAEALDLLKSQFSHLTDELDGLVEKYDEFQAKRKGFDDPEDLMRMLRGAGVLEFRIAVRAGAGQGVNSDDLRAQLQEVGAENTDSTIARWFEINDLKQWYKTEAERRELEKDPATYFLKYRQLVADIKDGKYYMLLYNIPTKILTHEGDTKWSITKTFPTADQMGRAAVGFNLDVQGAGRMGRLTGAHIDEPMAILLDDQVYSAPSINSQITSSGTISGDFTAPKLSYLIRVLAAGALEARLDEVPIAINNLGPSLGKDNLLSGLESFKIAIVAVALFMLIYYFFAGLVADFALLCNGILIFGIMAALQGTFTLPGLAGLVLTIGMAVDANVLIYERIREEIFGDEDIDLKTAIRLGYAKALSTIIDANVTNLIICAVLYKTATTEVKGFATILSIGICATLFTSLFVTRQIYYLYTDLFKIKKLPMLATTIPAIHRLLEPNIPWIKLRGFFWLISILALIASVTLVWNRGIDMFDTELRGGLSITMLTRGEDTNGNSVIDDEERLLLRHTGDPDSVEERIHKLGDVADPQTVSDIDEQERLAILRELTKAVVLTAGNAQSNPVHGGIEAYSFQVKIASPGNLDDDQKLTQVLTEAIKEEFGDKLDTTRPLSFSGVGSDSYAEYTYEIENQILGENFGQPKYTERIPEYVGGVVVLIENLDQATHEKDISERILRMRQQPDYSDCSGRNVKVFGLEPFYSGEPERGFKSVAIVVYERNLSSMRVDQDTWDQMLAKREWQLISAALVRETSFEQVSAYSAAVAHTLQANATVAVILSLLGILVYIWIRFGSLRYSIAAIVALVHDVTIALGLLALSAIIANSALGPTLHIEEFRIDLGVVAALLTIIGYSLNDTIVILDRIRENRGKRPAATAPIINRSINQTISRTLLTSVTTLVAVFIMYVEGGTGIRPFTFCLLTGLVVGTYSSVAIAAPLVLKRGDGSSTPVLPIEETSQEVV